MSSISDKLKRLHVTILFFLLIISGCNSTIEEHKVTASSISRSRIPIGVQYRDGSYNLNPPYNEEMDDLEAKVIVIAKSDAKGNI